MQLSSVHLVPKASSFEVCATGEELAHSTDMIKITNMSETCFLFTLFHNRWLNGRWSCRNNKLVAPLLTVPVLSSTGYLLVLGVTLTVVIRSPGMTGGKAGFVLGFAETITNRLVRCMELLRAFESSGVSLERLAEYRNLETEDIAPLHESQSDSRGDTSIRLLEWPSSGEISVTNLSARYAPDLPDILHDVSFSCAGGQRVGIVGATGGGKSTLAKALFRFVEISNGKVEIDNEGMLSSSRNTSVHN